MGAIEEVRDKFRKGHTERRGIRKSLLGPEARKGSFVAGPGGGLQDAPNDG